LKSTGKNGDWPGYQSYPLPTNRPSDNKINHSPSSALNPAPVYPDPGWPAYSSPDPEGLQKSGPLYKASVSHDQEDYPGGHSRSLR